MHSLGSGLEVSGDKAARLHSGVHWGRASDVDSAVYRHTRS